MREPHYTSPVKPFAGGETVFTLVLILLLFGSLWAFDQLVACAFYAINWLLNSFGKWMAGISLAYMLGFGMYRWNVRRRQRRWKENLDALLHTIHQHFIEPGLCCVAVVDGQDVQRKLGDARARLLLDQRRLGQRRGSNAGGARDAAWVSCHAGDVVGLVMQAITRAGTPAEGNDPSFTVRVCGTADIPASFKYKEKGRYAIKFCPRRKGTYRLEVMYNGILAAGATMKCVVLPTDLDPGSCTARGEGKGPLPLYAEKEYSVGVELRDRYGNLVTEGGRMDKLVFEFDGAHYARTEDNEDGTYSLYFVPLAAGVFDGRVKYDGVVVQGGHFSVVVITTAESVALQRHVSGGRAVFNATIHLGRAAGATEKGEDEVHFEGRFSAVLTLTPHRLLIKKASLGLFAKSIYHMKMRHSVKMSLKGGSHGSLIVVDDGMNIFNMEIEDRNMFYATAMSFLHGGSKIASEEPFSSRRSLFFAELQDQHATVLEGKALSAWSKKIIVSPAQALRQTLAATSAYTTKQWRQQVRIKFAEEAEEEEEDNDAAITGQAARVLEACEAELFADDNGLFASRASRGKRLLLPQPYQYGRLEHFKFAGLLLAKALYDVAVHGHRRHVRAHLGKSLYKQIVGLPVHYEDFRGDDPEFYARRVEPVLFLDTERDVPMYFLETETPPGKPPKAIPLVPNGANVVVTEDNKQRYLSILSQYTSYKRVHKQIDAFLEGFYSLVPEHLVSIFDEGEVEFLLCGLPEVSVAEMRASASLGGWLARDVRVANWFWDVLRCSSAEFRGRVLQLMIGTSQVPEEGWATLKPAINLYPAAGRGTRGRRAMIMPHADPATNTLFLDEYSSYEELRVALCEVLGLPHTGGASS